MDISTNEKEYIMIKVYQIQLTDAEFKAINSGEITTRTKAYFDRSLDTMFKAENFQYYTHVANVSTDDMEYAFKLMNLWERPELIYKFERCSSMSVGDILELNNGDRYRCASFGFEEI
jgi:hypothetical protein